MLISIQYSLFWIFTELHSRVALRSGGRLVEWTNSLTLWWDASFFHRLSVSSCTVTTQWKFNKYVKKNFLIEATSCSYNLTPHEIFWLILQTDLTAEKTLTAHKYSTQPQFKQQIDVFLSFFVHFKSNSPFFTTRCSACCNRVWGTYWASPYWYSFGSASPPWRWDPTGRSPSSPEDCGLLAAAEGYQNQSRQARRRTDRWKGRDEGQSIDKQNQDCYQIWREGLICVLKAVQRNCEFRGMMMLNWRNQQWFQLLFS